MLSLILHTHIEALATDWLPYQEMTLRHCALDTLVTIGLLVTLAYVFHFVAEVAGIR